MDTCYLADAKTRYPVPLFNINLKVNVIQSVAEFLMTQQYANFTENIIETAFFFPNDIQSVITKISIEFTMADG